jgi:hypothetical protein
MTSLALPIRTRPARPEPRLELAAAPAPVPPAKPSPFSSFLLVVDFRGPDGAEWSAVGGGESVVEAVEIARQSLPPGREWTLAGWNELYGS